MHLPCHREHFKSQSGVMKSEETSTGQASSCRSLDAFSKKPCPSMVNWTQFHLKRRVFYRIYPWTLRTCGSDVSKWQWLNQPQKKMVSTKKIQLQRWSPPWVFLEWINLPSKVTSKLPVVPGSFICFTFTPGHKVLGLVPLVCLWIISMSARDPLSTG